MTGVERLLQVQFSWSDITMYMYETCRSLTFHTLICLWSRSPTDYGYPYGHLLYTASKILHVPVECEDIGIDFLFCSKLPNHNRINAKAYLNMSSSEMHTQLKELQTMDSSIMPSTNISTRWISIGLWRPWRHWLHWLVKLTSKNTPQYSYKRNGVFNIILFP